MLTRDLSDMDRLIVENIHRIRALGFDVVVHIPRSGTIPASLIATYLRAPFASVEEYCAGMVYTRKSEVRPMSRILLVDDSIRTGEQMQAAVARIRQFHPVASIATLAVYSTEYPRQFQPTMLLAAHAETHYIYPWFMWKTKRIAECAVDLDGVLCRDCGTDEDDDGERYRAFLDTAEPKLLTPYKIGAIVTGRLEKYRPQTEAWLRRHGIDYGALHMGPWDTKSARKGVAAAWKAEVFGSSSLRLFIESSERDAETISRISGKPVWSIETQRRHG